jgi:hypothetical protein
MNMNVLERLLGFRGTSTQLRQHAVALAEMRKRGINLPQNLFTISKSSSLSS